MREVACPRCDGIKFMFRVLGDETSILPEECILCNGKGTILVETCSHCGGTGEIISKNQQWGGKPPCAK